jgi:hypothetical protein
MSERRDCELMEEDAQRYWTILACWRSFRSSISRSRASIIADFRSSDAPVGTSTCFTAMRSPFVASMPR